MNVNLERQKILNDESLSEIEKEKQLTQFDCEAVFKRRKPTNVFPKKKKRKK